MSNEIILIEGVQNGAANTIESVYQNNTGSSVQVIAFTASNNTGANHSYKAYIYDETGSSAGAIRPTKIVTSLRGFDLCPPIIGQIVPNGGSIRTESSTASTIIFYASGRVLV